MNIDDFQIHSLSTVALKKKDVAALAHRTLGLNGEAGILSNHIKKIIRDNNGKADAQDLAEIKKRLGDVLYYTAILAGYYNITLSDIAEQNTAQSNQFKNNRK